MDVCFIQEVRYKNKGTTSIGANEEMYKFRYSGNETGTNGVGVLIKHELAENVIYRFRDLMTG